MRRLLPLVLLAAACATSTPKEQKVAGPGVAGAFVPPGFEASPGENVTTVDLAHRGKPDVWKYTRKDASGKEILLRKEKDLNGDGKVDTWERYEPDGSLSRVAYDLDFDGRPDVTLYFEKDQLVRKERDTNGDGKVDTWEYWENGEVDRIGVDLDGDGQVDRWEARKSAAAPAEGAIPAAAQK